MTHEIRNTHEARDDLPPRWPREGEFMPDRALADAIEHHLAPLRRERGWCGNLRAEPRIVNAISQLETAIALLRTERHR